MLTKILKCGTVFSGCMLLSKAAVGVLTPRSNRRIIHLKYQIPQIITLFSLLLSIFAWKSKIRLKNFQWLIRIWASKIFQKVEN